MGISVTPVRDNSQNYGFNWKVFYDDREIFSGMSETEIEAKQEAMEYLLLVKLLEYEEPSVIVADGVVQAQNESHMDKFGELHGQSIALDGYHTSESQLWPGAVIGTWK
ncbi:MAG: hypothetical protein ACFBSC_18765 [Microcoleaceae cyanobacterium]